MVLRFLIIILPTNKMERTMKKLFVTFVFLSALLIVGCQENSITNPVQSDISKSLTVDNSSETHTGTLVLDGLLNDPHPLANSFFMINGDVQYSYVMHMLDPVPPNPQYSVTLNLSVDAVFHNYCTVCQPPISDITAGTISAQTSDVFTLSDEVNYALTKSFRIQGSEDAMILKVRFIVSTGNLSIDSMWLELDSAKPYTNNF
jgi:hypothetical protein